MPQMPAKLQDTLSNLALLPERSDRIEMLISIADRFQPVPEEVASWPYPEEQLVPACESEVYAWALPRQDGTLDFRFAVENPQGISAMALAVIIQDSFSGAPLDEVAAVSKEVVLEIFGNELSMGKSMGLMSMVGVVQARAQRALGREPARASCPE